MAGGNTSLNTNANVTTMAITTPYTNAVILNFNNTIIDDSEIEIESVEITNAINPLIYRKKQHYQNKTPIDLGGTPMGVYVVRAVDKRGNIYIDKFIKN